MLYSDSLLTSLVEAHLGSPVGVPQFQRIATGKFNTSFFVQGWERELVLRIAPPEDEGFVFYERGMMAQEPEIHRIIRSRTSAPVAEILAYDDSRRLIDRDFLIMERLPGRPLTEAGNVSQDFNDRVLYQVGRHLRQIHEITSDAYGYLGAHKPMSPQRDWPSAFRIMWNLMIEDIRATEHYSYSEAEYMRRLLDDNLDHFQRPVESCLLHMDIWHQNILVDEQGNVTGLIDLDRALWGDPEIEFAVLDYCGISELEFWQGYGEERDWSASASVRQRFYLLYEVQKYIVIHHWRHGDDVSAARYKAQVMNLARQLPGGAT